MRKPHCSEAHGWSAAAAAGSNLDHHEWTARKWDRDIDNLASRTRRDVRAAMKGRLDSTGKDWFDVATEQDLRNAVARSPITIDAGGETVEWPLERVLRHLEQEQDASRSSWVGCSPCSTRGAGRPGGCEGHRGRRWW